MSITIEPPPIPEKTQQPIGIYNDIPDADYRAWDGLSNSALTQLIEWSPYHLDYWRRNPPPKTDALVIGSALHCRVLRPKDFDAEFVIAEQCGAQLAKGGQCRNSGIIRSGGGWVCGVHGRGLSPDDASGIEVITEDQASSIEAMSEAIMRHPAANQIVTDSEGWNEVSIRWDRETHGKPLACKARLDGIRPSWNAVIDIKTTDCARKIDFTKSIGEFGYHRQGAYYIEGLKAAGFAGPMDHFVLIAVEKKPPYGVATYRVMGDALEAGREELANPIGVYANCLRSGKWFGYPSEFEDISLPRWKFSEIAGNTR